jgi:hypothetical protein
MPVQQRNSSGLGASEHAVPAGQRAGAVRSGKAAGNVRVGFAERDEVARDLATHCAEGRLTIDELDERLMMVWSARTRQDLREVVADLPDTPPPEPASPTWRSLVEDGRSLLLALPMRVLVSFGAAALLSLVFLLFLARGYGGHAGWGGPNR